MNDGWIKISRKLLEWEWADDIKMSWLWQRLLLLANYEDKKWHGVVVKRGQLVVRLKDLTTRGVTMQNLRTLLKRLESSRCILRKSTNEYTIITICNYDDYQVLENINQQTNNKQTTNEQQTNNNPSTTTKEIKKERIEKESNTKVLPKKEVGDSFFDKQKKMEQRNKEFYEELVPYVEIYGKDMIREFYDYWTEPNKSRTQNRKDLERTWNTSRRLSTWHKNNLRRNATNKPNTTADIATARDERRTELAGIMQARIAQIEANGK